MAEVLSVQMPDGQSYFNKSIRRSSPSQSFIVASSSTYAGSRKPNVYHQDRQDVSESSLPSSAPSSPRQTPLNLSNSSSFASTSGTSFTLETDSEDEHDDELAFPSYGSTPNHAAKAEDQATESDPEPSEEASSSESSLPDPAFLAEDDTAVRSQPSQHVDYLSHDWKEEDIWSSWRHIVSKRSIYGERSRLENASWRTWTKCKYNLKTVSPETLNWLKDCDVTWLYGPLQPSNKSFSHAVSEPPSSISKSNSFLNKKPILKKRSMSEVMLQKSLSSSSLVKQAADAVQAQHDGTAARTERGTRRRPNLDRAFSDFSSCTLPSGTTSRDTSGSCSSSSTTSGLQTPDHCEKKHIRFDDKVEQCIAVDCKDCDEDEDEDGDEAVAGAWNEPSDDSSDDEVVMMKKSATKTKQLSRTNSRGSFSGESKTIAKLPSTTLKYRTDSPDVANPTPNHSLGFFRSSQLSPSPSQETIRPANPSANFLLPEDEDDTEISWEPSGAFASRHDSLDPTATGVPVEGKSAAGEGAGTMRRTSSGMFMPYEDEEEASGILGRVVDTVNTARDIAHVIWNVGWRK